MGADNSKEDSRSNSRDERQRRYDQYVTERRRQETSSSNNATYQSPTQTPTERSWAPYNQTSENLQSVTKQASQVVLERSRNPYNYNSTELHGNKQSPNLYPNLNVSHGDSFVYIDNNGQLRTPPKPSAPPAAEVNEVCARPLASQVNATPNLPSTPRPPFSQANVVQNASVSHVNATPKLPPPRPPQPPASSPVTPGPSNTGNPPANKNGHGPKSGARNRENDISCPTCGQPYGLTIFQCGNGHASCKDCRMARRSCGKCLSPITDMRNIAMEAVIADVQTTCRNQGCQLRFKIDEMQRHLKECPFGEMDCPMGTVFGQCSTRCKVADMAAHFDEHHKEQRAAEIDKEMYVFNICMETHKMFLIKNGPHTFLVHLRVNENERKIFMTVQLLGTKISAEKWTYELHVYNKRQPLRKYLYVDSCQSIGTPIEEIFKDNQCATLPLSYAMTFVNESALTYKFYIKKEMNQRPRGRPRNKNNNA